MRTRKLIAPDEGSRDSMSLTYYHRFQFYATIRRGFFIRRKLCFGCRQSYHIWCVDKTSLVGLKDFVFLKYRSSSTTDIA